MIDDMYNAMARINRIRSRFGIKRRNPAVNDSGSGQSYRETHDKAVGRQERRGGAVDSGREGINKIVSYYASRNRVPSSLVRAVIEKESGYNVNAVSKRGAMGLMQLMPSIIKEQNVKDPFDPVDNIRAGVSHLKGLLDEYNGDYKKALAAYNAGRGAVKRYNGVPEFRETKEYVNNVIKMYLDNK